MAQHPATTQHDAEANWLVDIALGPDEHGYPNRCYVCCTQAEEQRLLERVREIHGEPFVVSERLCKTRPQDCSGSVNDFATAMEMVEDS